MKTEQAHSNGALAFLGGRDAGTPLPEPRLFSSRRIPRLRDAVPAVTWLNLVCLDAPIVAVTWLCLFAKVFRVPISLGNVTALFLTAWLIYLADRLVDALALKIGAPHSLRQGFCLRHRQIWIGSLVIIAGFDAFVIWRSIAATTFFMGTVVGVLALFYLAVNHPFGLVWRSLPAKEIAIGLLFAAGTLVALLPAFPPLTLSFLAGAIVFAGLCALNCVAIACWERELDRAQRKVSIATRYPGLGRSLGKICVLFALGSLLAGAAWRESAPIFGCVAPSALFLAMLGAFSESSLGSNQRTALADLVLLTPLVPLFVIVFA